MSAGPRHLADLGSEVVDLNWLRDFRRCVVQGAEGSSSTLQVRGHIAVRALQVFGQCHTGQSLVKHHSIFRHTGKRSHSIYPDSVSRQPLSYPCSPVVDVGAVLARVQFGKHRAYALRVRATIT